MDAREKLNEFADLRGLNKNQPLGWSVASDFAECYAEQLKIGVEQSEQLCYCGKVEDSKYSPCCSLEHWHDKFS